MNTKQLFQQINYAYCPKGANHIGQPLSRVCVDTKCQSKQLICSICEQLNHKGHDTIPLKHFLKAIISESNLNNSQTNYLYQLAQIERHRNSCLSLVRQRKRDLNQKFIELERTIIKYFDDFDVIGKNILDSQSPINQIIDQLVYSSEINAQQILSKFQNILKVVELDEEKKFSLKDKFDNLTNFAIQKQRKISSSLILLDIQINKTFDFLNKSFLEKITYSSSPVQFFWSNTLKGAKIKINQLIAQQTGMESSGQRFILMQPSFGKSLKKKNWGIRIKKFGGWIGIGISLAKLIKNANYHFNYTVLGHGSYLISTNGYSWSHSVKQFNSAFKCFQFTVNDIVYMQFDPIANKLRFRKNDSVDAKDKFQLDIDPTPIGDDYHPSANLCSTNDNVQIIYPGKPLS